VSKVLVIGDGCKDIFQYGKCERLSPEAPVPVFKPTKKNNNGGMAVNVYANLLALGIDCDIITDSGATKTRFVDEISNQMLLRVDENDEIAPIQHEILAAIPFDDYSVIIISDYNKGFLYDNDIKFIAKNHKQVFLDTKKKFGHWVDNIFCIKINKKEFMRNKQWLDFQFDNLLIVTLGNEGAMYKYPKEDVYEYQTILNNEDHPVRDLSGAGDTFMAALVAKYLEKNNIPEAIKFANKCSSWVVTQKGVVTIDLNKIRL